MLNNMCCEIFISLATEQERREDQYQAHPSFKEDFRQAVICSPSFITFLTLVTPVCSERVTSEICQMTPSALAETRNALVTSFEDLSLKLCTFADCAGKYFGRS